MNRRIVILVVAIATGLSGFVRGQVPPNSTWEFLGPEGGYLTSMIQDGATGTLYGVSYGNPARIFRSTNDGDQWQNISQLNDNISYLCLDGQHPQNIIAVGSYLGYGTSLQVYKSTDGGQSWGVRGFSGEASTYYYPQHLEVDPSDSRKLTLVGYSFAYEDGAYSITMFECRTKDGGETWTVKSYPGLGSGELYGLCGATDPADDRIRYMGGYLYTSMNSFGKVFRSTDSGVTWSDITGTVLQGYVYDLHMDRTVAGKMFAVTSAGVYLSTDRGSTWLSTPRYAYGNRICCDPKNGSVLYVYGNGTTIFESTDGGGDWRNTAGTLSGGTCTSLIPAAKTSGSIFASTRSGFFRSTDRGQSWVASNKGLASAEVPVLRCAPASPHSLFISFLYSGFYKTTNALAKPTPGGLTWQKLPEYSYCEGIMHLEVHPTNPDIIYIQEGAGWGNTGLFKSTTGGASWTEISRVMRGYNFRLAGALYEAGSWYDQGLGVYRAALRISRDDGKSWMQYLLSDAMSAAYCVAPDPSDMNIVYVGGEESKPNGSYPVMFKTTNGGSSWSRIATNITNYSGDRFRLLEIDKKNPSKIFAATSNSVYISTDRGVSWGAGKTINYASSLLIDPANSQNVYLGCSDGVFASQNGGTTWTDISRNLLCKNVEALEYDSHNQVLYAGTVYGGVFRMVLNPLVSVESSGPAAEYGLDQNYPNPFNPVTTISYRLTAASEVRLEVVDVLGKVVQVLDEGHRAAGGYSVRWDASGFPSGVYFCQLQARPTDGGQAGSLRQTRRMILMKWEGAS